MAKETIRYDRHQLGRGKGGGTDWIAVRLNSLALIALFTWLLVSLLLLPDLSYPVMREWLALPLNAVLMILLIVTTFWHAKYGLKELVDDYVHDPGLQAVAALAIYAFVIVGTVFGIWSVARIGLASS